MSKKEKLVIPKLRFLQFKDDPRWVVNKFGKLVIPVEEKAGTKKYILMSVTSGVGLVSQKEKFGREIAGNAYKNYYVIKKNDFAYNKSATKQFPEGYISMLTEYKEAALPNSIFTCFRIVDPECETRFFDHLFHNNYHGMWLRKYIEVGARAHGSLNVDTKHLWNMPIALPKLSEQQKIADCLSSLDDLIAAEDQKLLALRAHKNGLMQKLFPAEGETAPKWRFPEFRNSGEWTFDFLRNMTIKIGSGVTPRGGETNYIKEGHPFVRSQNVGWGCLILDDIVYIDDKTHNSAISTQVYTDDVLLNITGASIGRVAVANMNVDGGNVNQHVCIIRTIFKKLIPQYLCQYLLSQFGQKQIDSFQAGGNRQGLNFAQIRSLSVPLSPVLEEQQKIADCLSTVDSLITAQSEKIEALKVHKKGLMQGLFPSIEEVEA